MKAACPTHNPFRVDKEKSLAIMKEILTHLKAPEQISLQENMKWDDHYLGTECEGLVEYRHKLRVVELEVTNGMNEPKGGWDVDELSTEFYTAIADHNYEVSDQIELHFGSEVMPSGEINLIAYLHDTSAECDVSYPLFTYDELYACWIVKQKFWGAPKGVDGNGQVLILDFSMYLQ